ncbi:hypothetical protein ISR94_02575 [Candidatus Microgenomates bacterium]|nr:hypothetical protein [Candidatus Microgenomates bacterium]
MERLNKQTNSKLVEINDNTVVFYSKGQNFNLEKFLWDTTKKVKTRININLLGLNGLATTIVPPQQVKDLTMQDLHHFLNISNKINQNIGLPFTGDLIIRTSAQPPFKSRNKNFTNLSEPMLLAINILNNPTFKLKINGELLPISRFEEFKEKYGRDCFYMIHDDNDKLQTAGIHGAINELNGTTELYLRTGSLHARSIGDPQDSFPTVRINAKHPEDLFKIYPHDIEQASANNVLLRGFRNKIRAVRCNSSDSRYLSRICHSEAKGIIFAHRTAQEKFGKTSTTEFRIYPTNTGGIGSRLHVLDVDYRMKIWTNIFP